MPSKSQTSGFLLVILLAGVGYALVALPPTIIAQYQNAADISPVWGYAYLATVGVGAFILTVLATTILIRLWRNTRTKQKQRERRERDPSRLSPEDQQHELADNLAQGTDFAGADDVSDAVRAEIRGQVAAIEQKLASETLQITAFGTISSGKSSVLNALAGRDMFRTDPRGGTTLAAQEIPWPGGDRVVLADTPGLAEVQGEGRAAAAAQAAQDADLVLFVVDGPMKAYEIELLRQLGAMEKRTIVCLNKEDWFSPSDREELLEQITGQVSRWVSADDIVSVQARRVSRRQVRVLPDGREAEESVAIEPDIGPLADRMLAVIKNDRRALLLGNLLLQSRGLVEASKDRVRESLDRQADQIVGKYMWAAGGVTAANPLPLLDLAGGSAVTVKMVLDLARVYRQPVDTDTVVTLLAQLSKNLVGMLGVTAATPAIVSVVASLIKTVPGVGTIAGGIVQGLVQALITRWIGKVFIIYFREEMSMSKQGLAEIARTKWSEVTRPEELLKLIQAGRRALSEK